MSSSTIDQAFVKHYEAEVHMAYQRMGTKLRNTVRTKNNVRGSSAVFRKVGSRDAVTKERNAKIPLSEEGSTLKAPHSAIDVALTDYYAGEWIDALDELRTNTDEKIVAAQAGAYALGRKTDELIIDALNLGTNSKNTVAVSATGLTKGKITEALEMLGAKDVPDDGQRFAIVGWKQWSQLLSLEEFANSNYVGDDDLPWKGTQAKNWLGTLWMPHSGLKLTGTTRSCHWYHRSAVGHAVGKDITSDVTWHGDYAAYFVNNMMSQGAGVIDSDGLVTINCKE